MGTYRQPGLVLDKTLGMIPEAIEDINSKIIKDVEANRARKLKEEQERIKKDLNRFNKYELPNRANRYGRRRNN